MTDYDMDLATRWTPSVEQDRAAAIELGYPGIEVIYSVHVLIGKEPHWWGDGITVFHLHGVQFTDRNKAFEVLGRMTELQHRISGKPCTGGYTIHTLDTGDVPQTSRDGRTWQTHWGVFEDGLSVQPPRVSRRET